MRLTHFDLLRPRCPRCALSARSEPLAVASIERERDADIEFGTLSCGHCGSEYPIVDGLPVIVPDVRRFVSDNLFYLLARDDLPHRLESLLGDAAGPGSGLDLMRQHVSSYVWDHWADYDPQEAGATAGGAVPGGVVRALEAGLAMLPEALPDGPVLDLGCGPGRTVSELSRRLGRPVLGIDLSVPLARAGRRAITRKRVAYDRRRIGLVYDRREFPVEDGTGELADIWICDAGALPFADGTFSLAVGFNVLDCLADPRSGLAECGRALRGTGSALFSVPFDWSAQVTPPEAWIGGHSQRGPHSGAAEELLDGLLSDGNLSAGALRKQGDSADVPWHVRLHDRSCMHYRAHMVAARRI